jgi:hypothetical protein
MNELIRELHNQCIVREQRGTTAFDSYVVDRFDSDRFAQLIVAECLKIVEPDRTSGDEWCVTLDETAQSIRQHFGLELKYD